MLQRTRTPMRIAASMVKAIDPQTGWWMLYANAMMEEDTSKVTIRLNMKTIALPMLERKEPIPNGIILRIVVKGEKNKTRPKNIVAHPTMRMIHVVTLPFCLVLLKASLFGTCELKTSWSCGVKTPRKQRWTRLQAQQHHHIVPIHISELAISSFVFSASSKRRSFSCSCERGRQGHRGRRMARYGRKPPRPLSF